MWSKTHGIMAFCKLCGKSRSDTYISTFLYKLSLRGSTEVYHSAKLSGMVSSKHWFLQTLYQVQPPFIFFLANQQYWNLIYYHTCHTFIAAAFASLSNVRYVVHEKRDAEPSPQHRTSVEVDPSTIILLSIALTQRNLDKGHDFLIDMSNPLGSNHKKHW
jgi:hypothetical protein